MTEWTGIRDDGNLYTIDQVTRSSAKKFKWICSKGHKWLSTINNRTTRKHNCPYCSGNLVSNKNSLEAWCMSNGSFGQQLKSEWIGLCEDGKHYKIDEVSYGSSKKFKWVCSKDHEWFATVANRTNNKSSCPYCSCKRVSDRNSLKTWCLNNGSFGEQLIKEWTGECTDGEHCKIDDVSFGSHKKFKWKCGEGHEWIADVIHRTFGRNCPYCSGHRVSNESSLKTWCSNNGDFGKQLLSEWTGECDDGSHYRIDEVSFGSNKEFKWKCSEGHEWLADVHRRTARKSGCPYCFKNSQSEINAKAKLSDENSLETWCKSNGSFGQQLKSEWTGLCEDGRRYAIDQVTRASRKKFKWRCSKDHEWYAAIYSRTARKQGCPNCNNQGTSYPEQFIYWSLKQIFPNTENRCKVLRSPQNPKGVEFDIGISEIPLCIEYSPTCWHEGKEERDKYKKDLCEEYGVRLIQIVEDSYDILDSQMKPDYICFKMNYNQQDEILTKIVDHILKTLGHSISEIDIETVKKNAWDYSKNKIEYEKSLAGIYPELAKEWHPALNNNLKPDEIKCGSSKKVYWQCPKCNHGENGEWQAMVYNRVHRKTGCPKCGHNWYKT